MDEIMDHPWMNQAEQIPDFLPESTLFEPPTAAFLKQYLPEELGGAYKDDQTPLEYEQKVQEWRNNQIAGIANKRINLGKNPNTIAPQDGLGQDLTLIRAQQDEEILRKIELEKQKQFQDLFKPDPVYYKREKPEIYVKKWIDYTHKYGFGCILSNDSVCVNFNDGSRMILEEDLHHISYYEAREELTKTPANYDCFTLGTYPPELSKKVQLM